MANTILLKGDAEFKEYVADSGQALLPGELVELVSGKAGTVQAHSTDTGLAAPVFVSESMLYENGISGTYDAADQVPCFHAQKGTEVYAWIAPSADGDGTGTVAVGAAMESHGTGNLTTGTTNPIVYALEEVKNSSGSDPARVKVVVI